MMPTGCDVKSTLGVGAVDDDAEDRRLVADPVDGGLDVLAGAGAERRLEASPRAVA
jgi:hypothetical protein